MGLKKYLCLFFACISIFSCVSVPASAADIADIGERAAEITEPRATGEFKFEISAKSIRKASTSFPMEYGETVTITASYRTVGSYLWNALLGGEELTIHGNQGKLLNLVFWNDSEIIKSAMLTSEKEVLCEGTLYFVQNDDLVDGIWTFLDK